MKTTILAILLATASVAAQTTIKDALVKHWKATGELTIAVANAMPAESYTFRPNPEEMSFGQLMAHIAGPDLNACANASVTGTSRSRAHGDRCLRACTLFSEQDSK